MNKFGIFCLILGIALIGFIASILYFTLPLKNGEIYLKNSHKYQNVHIYRDEYGMPHIQAQSFKDSIYGVGAVMAQDRLWTMHMRKMIASGILSEIGGSDTLELDKFFRSLGITRAAENQAQSLDSETEQILQAFCDGINDMVGSFTFLPIEFWITGQTFEIWQKSDTFRISLLLNLFLSFDFMFEPFKELVKQKYSRDFAEQVFGSKSRFLIDNTTILSDNDLKRSKIYKEYIQNVTEIYNSKNIEVPKYFIDQFVKLTQIELLEVGYQGYRGSNSWVVNGNHTKSGKPILANDPHMDNYIPSLWYPCEIIYKDINHSFQFVTGAIVPGIPGVIIGRNAYAAWGVTNNVIDTTDLYLEKFDNKGNYQVDGQWVKMKHTEEIIKIKGQKDYKLIVYTTHHGNLLESILDHGNVLKPFSEFKGLSLSWAGLQRSDTSLKSQLDYMRAINLKDFEKALKSNNGPCLNFNFATIDNHIGYYSIGNLPVRRDQTNIFIQDGTDSKNDWIRFYTKDENPRVVDPEKGFIVTANNRIASDNLVGRISIRQEPQSRSYYVTKLIEEKIKNKHKLTVYDMQKIQLNTIDGYCTKFFPQMLQIFEKYSQFLHQSIQKEKIQNIYQIMQNWTCDMASDSKPAAIFGIFEQKMYTKLFNDISDNQYQNHRVTMNPVFDSFFFTLLDNLSNKRNWSEPYCVNQYTIQNNVSNSCLYNYFKSFEEAYDMLEHQLGSDQTNWKWSNIVNHIFSHSPFSDTPLKYLFERQIKGQGNRRSINVEGVNMIQDKWKSIFSPNLRMVISLDDNEKSYYIIDTGVSEHILSSHFTDQMDIYSKDQYIEMRWGIDSLKFYNDILTINPSSNQITNDL